MEVPIDHTIGGRVFTEGTIGKTRVVCSVSGVGKVWAAICAEVMALRFYPDLVINTGIAGTLTSDLSIGDIAVSSSVCHHDFDTTAIDGSKIGDAAVPGSNGAQIPADRATAKRLSEIAREEGARSVIGPIASGDQFISSRERKDWIAKTFSAIACEMEGAAVGHVCAANGIPFCVVRAISDNADGDAPENYPEFFRSSAERSSRVVVKFITEK